MISSERSRTIRILFEGGSFFSAPRWHEGRWWVSDRYRNVVLAITPEGEAEPMMTVEGRPGGLGWLPDGSLLAVSMEGRCVLRRHPDGTVEVRSDLSSYCTGPANDMVVDQAGRAYVGHYGFDAMGGAEPAPAGVVRVDFDGAATLAAADLLFPSGLVVTPDGSTLIVGEAFASRYTAFAIGSDGSLAHRRVWAQLAPEPPFPTRLGAGGISVAPAGCCLDAEGHIWAADALQARLLRVAPGGRVVERLAVPAGFGVFACMLGGKDGRTLLMCAVPSFSEFERFDTRNGVLFTTRVDVPRAGLP